MNRCISSGMMVTVALGLCLCSPAPSPAQSAAANAGAAGPQKKRRAPAAAPAKPVRDHFEEFQAAMFEHGGLMLPYRYYQPTAPERGKKYPLVLLMHGYGERGLDNQRQLNNFFGVKFWEKHPCFVLAPQCPADESRAVGSWVEVDFGGATHTTKEKPTPPMQAAMALLDKFVADHPVDAKRIYVSGLSMGGFATWELLQREPEKFAAAVPVCGGADPACAAKLAGLPLWVFHGGADQTVKTQRSRDIVAALTAAGGHPKYTEYPGVGHNAWSATYGNPEVWDWLFEQARK